jgi:hypothetical protein
VSIIHCMPGKATCSENHFASLLSFSLKIYHYVAWSIFQRKFKTFYLKSMGALSEFRARKMTSHSIGKHDGTQTLTRDNCVYHAHRLNTRRSGEPREWSSCESAIIIDKRRVFVPEMRTTHFLLPYSIASTPFVYIPFRQWYDWPNQTVLHDNEVHYPQQIRNNSCFRTDQPELKLWIFNT